MVVVGSERGACGGGERRVRRFADALDTGTGEKYDNHSFAIQRAPADSAGSAGSSDRYQIQCHVNNSEARDILPQPSIVLYATSFTIVQTEALS